MPAIIEPALITLLLRVFAGQVPPPTNLYMGLGTPQEVSATDGGNPANPSGYARTTIKTSSMTVSGSTLTLPPQIFTFTAIPSPYGSANSWFLADAATGGNILAIGQLGDDGLAATIGAGSDYYNILVPTATGAMFNGGDVIKLGSTCAKNLEYCRVSSVGPFNGSTTTDLIQCAQYYPHPTGEAFTRDSQTRTYSAGWIETINASIQIVNQP